MNELEPPFTDKQLENACFYTRPIKDGIGTDLGEEYTGKFKCSEVVGGYIEPGTTYDDLSRFSIAARPVGSGGFANVYAGKFNGIERVFKFAPIYNEKGLDDYIFTNDYKGCWEYRRHVKAATEASGYSSIVDKPIAYFVAKIDDNNDNQTGKKTYFVIVMIRRNMNLQMFLSEYPRLAANVRLSILEKLRSLILRDDYYRSHGDLKLENILVDFDTDGQDRLVPVDDTFEQGSRVNSFFGFLFSWLLNILPVSNHDMEDYSHKEVSSLPSSTPAFELRVTDFGAAGWMDKHFGATPLFASPTCFEDSNTKDIFAFSRLVLILFMQRGVVRGGEWHEERTYWRNLLLLPVHNDKVDEFRGLADQHFPFLASLRNLLKCRNINQKKMDADEKRQLFDEIIVQLSSIHQLGDFTPNQVSFFTDLKKHVESEFLNAGEVLSPLNDANSYQFCDFHNRTDTVHVTFDADSKFLSRVAHNQGSSYKCWAYSAASMLRVSCSKLLEECLEKDRITRELYNETSRKLQENEIFHRQCCKLMTMVVLPKVLTTSKTENNEQQAEYVSFAMYKLAMPSILEDEGVFSIHPIYSFIVDDLNLTIDDIAVECTKYDIDEPPGSTFYNAVSNDLTPGTILELLLMSTYHLTVEYKYK